MRKVSVLRSDMEAGGMREEGKKKSGVELLSHTLTYSIIVAGPLNNRVRDGNVCCKTAVNTGKNK